MKQKNGCFYYMTHYRSVWKNDARNLILEVLHDVMCIFLQLLSDSVRAGFLVDVCGKEWKLHSAVVFDCFHISVGKVMSNVKHGVMMYLGIKYLISKHKVFELQFWTILRTVKTGEIFESYKNPHSVWKGLLRKRKRREVWAKMYDGESTFDCYRLNKNEKTFFSQEMTNIQWYIAFLFTVELLYLLCQNISKKLNECTMGRVSVTSKENLSAIQSKRRKTAYNCKIQLLIGYIMLGSANRNDFSILQLQVNLSAIQNSSQMKGIFACWGVMRSAKGKDHNEVETFSFSCCISRPCDRELKQPGFNIIIYLPFKVHQQLL